MAVSYTHLDVYKRQDDSLKVIDYIKNVAEYVKTPDGMVSASQMLEQFLFPSSMQYTLIGKLSGGEKRRLCLLHILTVSYTHLLTTYAGKQPASRTA